MVVQKKPSIYSFVEAGKEYFPKLCKALMALVYFTPVFHEDQKHLSTIVDGTMDDMSCVSVTMVSAI